MQDIQLVTGAFGFSGGRIAAEPLVRGQTVRTLTNSAARGPYADEIERFAFDPKSLNALRPAFRGVDTFYNTYWVRFHEAGFDQEAAIANSARMFQVAAEEGVRRIVHVSITNPSLTSPYAYFRGKAQIEQALVASGVPHSILRPGVLFGTGDVLLNNIAWLLRHMPIFGVFGDGEYGLRPIHVRDLALLALSESEQVGVRTLDAVGPESFTYREMVQAIADATGVRRSLVHVSPAMGSALSKVLGFALRDVLLTREEIDALMDGLLESDGPATGATALTQWLREHGNELGRRYASEVRRRRPKSLSELPTSVRIPTPCAGPS